MDILTHLISPFFRPRLKEIALSTLEADACQSKQLGSLLHTARNTEWGLKYDYKTIRTYDDFRQRIPLQAYDDMKHHVQRMINGEKNILWPSAVKWYAKSSGTTNDKSKFLPVTNEILKKCHYQGGFDTVSLYLRNNPSSNFFSHKGLILGGSHSPSSLNSRAHCGDLSAILLQNLCPLVNMIRVPSKRIILMDDWERKLASVVDSTRNENVNSLSGVPSWMLVLIKSVLQKTGKEYLTDVWPNLEVFFHGGVNFEPYREQYNRLIPSGSMHYMETYNASEGFFGIQDDPSDKSLLLMTDYGIFYEFIPLDDLTGDNPHAISLMDVEVGKNYALVITTAGGLWRYKIGDTIRFTSLHPHKFVISGRTKSYINAFGEELMVDNADKAIAEVCRLRGVKVKEYTAAPFFLLDRAKGFHQWLVEFEEMPDSIDLFASELDEALRQLNSDYEAKRYKEISLKPLEIIVARDGLFYDWLKQKGKLGGQHKIPRLCNDRVYMEELLSINK